MSTPIARVGDALDHGGAVVEGSPNWTCEGVPIARVGDAVICALHGPGTIVTGSERWSVNGKQMARLGSLCSCGAAIATGSAKWGVD